MTASGDGGLGVRLLGPVQLIQGDGRAVPVGRRLESALAVRLALARGRGVPDETLARDLWGDETLEPDRAVERLRVLAHRLRRALGPAGEALRRGQTGYSLDASPVDVVALDEAVGRIATARGLGELKVALGIVEEALACWRGPALAGLREVPFAIAEAARLDRLHLDLVVQRIQLEQELGLDVTAEAERLAVEHPLDERLVRLAATALYRAGRQADALDRIARLRDRLSRELGVDLAPESADLELRILRQDPSLRPLATARPAEDNPRLPELSWLTPRMTFVGRAHDVAVLRDELDRPGLVSIVGGPGAGKTLLARELAIGIRQRGRPVAWCDLATVDSAPGVLGVLAAAAGVEPGPDDPLPGCAEALAGACLVLDNAEHLIDEVATVTSRLLRATSQLSILVTSQRPVRISAEVVHQLGPLAADAAGELFRARCGFAVAGTDRRVDAICAAVDRMPLAIELAAGLTRTLTIGQLAARIDDRLRLLVAGNRDSGARHSSLQAAIDWSHALLSPPSRALLRRLAVFSGGCTLEAAEEVVSGNGVSEADIPALLADLHERSLLTVIPGAEAPRYVLLESIRDYARQRLRSDDDEPRLRRAHASWCAELAVSTSRYGGADHTVYDSTLRIEEPNLRAAIDWTLDNDPDLAMRIVSPSWWYWWSHGQIVTASGWLRRALASGDQTPTVERAGALRAAASLTRTSGEFAEARRLGEQALAIFTELGDEGGIASALLGLSITSMALREFDRALAEVTKAEEVARDLGNERLYCAILNATGGALRGLGRIEDAAAAFVAARERWIAQDDRRGLAGTLGNLALVRLQQGAHREARELCLEAVRIYSEIDLLEGVLDTTEVFASLEAADGRLANALRILTVTAAERERLNAPLIIPDELAARDATEATALAGLTPDQATAIRAAAASVPITAIVAEIVSSQA